MKVGARALKLLLLFGVVLILGSILFKSVETFESTSRDIIIKNNDVFRYPKIPKHIWTFWDGPPTDLVAKCIESWRKFNPTYEITVLDKETVGQYVDEIDLADRHYSVQKYSDMVRVEVLSKNGGIWMDASIVCYKPLDWIQKVQQKNKVEFVGFYSSENTLPEFKSTSPVIENWCFACVPNSTLVKDWAKEFKRINDYATVEGYLESLNANLQNIPAREYLTQHCAMQEILQKPNQYSMYLYDAFNTAFKPQADNEGDATKTMDRVMKKEYKNLSMVKLRGPDREATNENDYSGMFL